VQTSAIISDYDGTLCTTACIKDEEQNVIPEKLEDISWNIDNC